jgi:co-chaperonin GroES (HSP10)
MATVKEKAKETELERLEKKFAQLAQEIYEAGERRIQPTWPWVLIRLVPKEQRFGSLYLPDNAGAAQQNKPLWEGIVLETWPAHWSRVKQIIDGSNFRADKKQTEIWRESEFKRGDRVLFPSFAGLPVNFLDANNYRLVREWTFDVNGGCLGVLHYDGDKKYKPVLDELFTGLESITLSGK